MTADEFIIRNGSLLNRVLGAQKATLVAALSEPSMDRRADAKRSIEVELEELEAALLELHKVESYRAARVDGWSA